MQKIIGLWWLCLLWMTSCEQEPFQQGEILYNNFCANCHMEDGTGLKGNIPPLVNSDYLKDHQPEIACIIAYGQTDTIIVNGEIYHQPMPAVTELSAWEIANVINYINHAWGNDYGFVRIDSLEKELANCKE